MHAQPRPHIDASSLRRELFAVLNDLRATGPIEIRRHGVVVAVLETPPPPVPDATPTPKPHVDPRRLKRLCKKHHIKRLSLFGSIVRDDFGPTSDVDILYEPEPGHLGTLASLMAATEAMESLFGRRVDFIKRSLIEKSENEFRRQSIFEDEHVVYERGRVTGLARALA